MCHKLPPPLAPRTFPVLVVSALEDGADGGQPRTGIVVHVPIDISSFPLAMYSNGRNVKEGADNQQRKKVVLGYVAFPHTSWPKCGWGRVQDSVPFA